MSFDPGTVRQTILANPSFRNGKSICFVTVGCFEGMLVSRRVVDAIGLPDPKYFISWDDTLYGAKASAHTSVAYVRDAVLQKTLGDNPVSPWKTYYIIRNRYFIYKDVADYFGLKASKTDLLIFHFIRLVEALQSMLRGWGFVRPTVRGMVDGMAYLRGR
jgi:GT2 family glycosyltransferase